MKKHILWLLALAFAAGVAMAQVGFPRKGTWMATWRSFTTKTTTRRR